MLNVIFLGLVSFFADLSSEMVYPLIPIYLTSVLGATPTLVGVIEGIAESIASLLKVFSGYISDKYKKKKAIAFAGYASGLVYKIALVLAGSWLGILLARVIDRFGKGIRTAPRDVMIAECANEGTTGKTFGIHKMLDMAGSALGILLAFILFQKLGSDSYKTVFFVSLVPMMMALLMFTFIKENKVYAPAPKREAFWKNISQLDNRLKLYLVVTFIFTLGNSSNTFLLLRASDVGFSSTNVILLYFIYNTVASAFAIPFGTKSDMVGRKKVLVLGYITFAVVYIIFAVAVNRVMIISAFVLYGFYTAMLTGAEKAFISEIAPSHLKGTMLGLQSTLAGIALLPASIIAGILWDAIGSYAPFVFGAALSLLAAFVLEFGLNSSVPKKNAD